MQESILHLCIQSLSKKRRDETIQNKAEDLECLCQIMKTVGRLLDTEKAKPLMDQYFDRMAKFAMNTELPSRIRFMLQDVIELRLNKWVPRRVQREQAPKTILQIRQEAARDIGLPQQHYHQHHVPGGFPGNFAHLTAHLANISMRQAFGNNMHGYGMPLKPGQRVLDDMYSTGFTPFGLGTTLGTGPGVIAPETGSTAGHFTAPPNRRAANPHSPHTHSQMPHQHSGASPQIQNAGVNHQTFNSNQAYQYRGSLSQEKRKEKEQQRERSENGKNYSQNNYNLQQNQQNQQQAALAAQATGRELPPRFRKQLQQQHTVNQPSLANVSATSTVSLTPPLNSPVLAPIGIQQLNKPQLQKSNHFHETGEISLRPAQNSMVSKHNMGYNKHGVTPPPTDILNPPMKHPIEPVFIKPTPILSKSNKSATNSDTVPNAKNNSATRNSKDIILEKVESALNEFVQENKNFDDIIKQMSDLKIPKK